jgi:hypothetical protein
VQIGEFEKAVWRTDHVRLVIRAPKSANVQDFDLVNAADKGLTVKEYLSIRIKPRVW